MSARNKQTIVLSLGGSLIAPASGIDVDYLKKFRAMIASEVKQGRRFVLVCGGGTPARSYMQAARQVSKITPVEADWLGIQATWLNAKLVQTVFGPKLAHGEVITDLSRPIKTSKPVIVAGGWKPGCSTDNDAVFLAKRFGAKTIVNLSNTRYVYDRDPRLDASAKPILKMTWPEFRRLVGTKWIPGKNVPFDPIAAGSAAKWGMSAIVTDGHDLKNIAHIISGKKFDGTCLG